MSEAKRLLEQATPLPWTRRPATNHIEWSHPEGLAQNVVTTTIEDAALIVYAVNRLPDYEAAVEALERLLGSHDVDGGETTCSDCEPARTVLARLRDEVPA